jgi:FAD/FMN-containing dehydrogenase
MATEEPQELFAVNKTYLAELVQEKASKAMAPWTVVVVIRGADAAEIAYKKKDMQAIARQVKGTLSTGIKGVSNVSDAILSQIQSPAGSALHKNKKEWAPVVTVCTADQVQTCSKMFPASSGAIMMPLQAGGCFYYQPDIRFKESDIDQARKSYEKICMQMLKAGVLFPRPSALIAKQVAKQYPDYFKLLRSIKKAVDPKNIMNPGKLGL